MIMADLRWDGGTRGELMGGRSKTWHRPTSVNKQAVPDGDGYNLSCIRTRACPGLAKNSHEHSRRFDESIGPSGSSRPLDSWSVQFDNSAAVGLTRSWGRCTFPRTHHHLMPSFETGLQGPLHYFQTWLPFVWLSRGFRSIGSAVNRLLVTLDRRCYRL